MLKLMKYEFMKLRAALGIMALALVALEAGFIVGHSMGREDVWGVCLGLLAALAFVVYLYILLAGISSYGRELNDKTGYLVFMAPVSPVAVVASKLLFTILAALVFGGLFGAAACYDLTRLLEGVELDAEFYEQINSAFRVFVANGRFDLTAVLVSVAMMGATVIIELLAVMCAAYMAITLSATLLQNRKGFLRFLLSLVLFGAIQYAMNKVNHLALGSVEARSLQEAMPYLLRELALEGAFCVLFAGVSAALLDRKVSL